LAQQEFHRFACRQAAMQGSASCQPVAPQTTGEGCLTLVGNHHPPIPAWQGNDWKQSGLKAGVLKYRLEGE
jgi:hypothetical protein